MGRGIFSNFARPMPDARSFIRAAAALARAAVTMSRCCHSASIAGNVSIEGL
jgi:hypothetical protein